MRAEARGGSVGSGSSPKRAAASAAAEVDGAPGRFRIPASRPRSSSARAGSSLTRLSRTTQARWPSAVATARSVSARRAAVVGVAVDRRQRAIRPREGLLDVRLGVAHQLAEQRQGLVRDTRVAAAPAVDVGHRRDRRTDQPALPARWREDELLELGPAVRLGVDALGVRVGEGVDGDPVAGLAGGPAEELPGPFGLGRERSLQEPEREPAWFQAIGSAEEPIGDEEQRRRALIAGGVRGSRATTAAINGQRTP